MTLTITIPRGVARKQPPPDRERPDLSPLNLTIPHASISNQGHGDPNLELFKQMVEKTERGNIMIRKLNKFRRQRRLESAGLSDVSDSEDEEPLPNIASFMARINTCALSALNSNPTTAADVVEPPTLEPLLDNGEEGGPQLGNSEWQAHINSQLQPVDPKQTRSDYIDYTTVGLAFKHSEATKKIHKLDLSAIPNGLKKMAHY